MSRVGKYPVVIPAGVTVTINGDTVNAKGKLGELSYKVGEDVTLKLEENNHYQTRFASGDAIVHYLWTKALLENL